MSVVEVYDLRQYIQVTYGHGDGMSLSNYPVNSTDVKVFRGVENNIDFRVRDIDRKPVVLQTGAAIDLVVNDAVRTALTKRLTVVDASRGVYRATLDPDELPQGESLLSYHLVLTDVSGREHLLFTDRSRLPRGSFVVADGPDIIPVPTIEIAFADMLPQSGSFVSSAFESIGARHTVVAEMNFYTGALVVEATLDDSPAITTDRWFEVERRNYIEGSARDVFDVVGNFSFVRFRVSPGIDNQGDLTKILYR